MGISRQKSGLAVLVIALVFAAVFVASPQRAVALPILEGFDFFETPEGGGVLCGVGPNCTGLGFDIPLMGNPIGPGNADTIVQRLDPGPAPGDTGTIAVEIVALSLVSVEPVNLGGDSFFDIFVVLDPGNQSLGLLTNVTHDDGAGGGTFDSFFDVFVQIDFVQVSGTPFPFPLPSIFVQDQLSSEGSQWSHTPPPFYPVHPDMPAGNFYPGPLLHDGPHPETIPATIPTPGTLSLLAVGIVGLGVMRRRRKAALAA